MPRNPALDTLTPEFELLLCCSRTRVSPAVAKRIHVLVKGKLVWPHLVELALHHGVAQLLYRNLWLTSAQAVPESVLGVLRQHFLVNSARNILMVRELFKILTLFQKHRIPVIPFKGPVLAASAYGDLTLRKFDDLDLLVHHADMLRAKGLLRSQGFRPVLRMARSQEDAYIRDQHGYDFESRDRSVRIEIHWHVTPRFFCLDLDPEELWERCRPTALGGFQLLGLSAEDELLLACVHGTKHLWRRLMWACDIAETVRTGGSIDWAEVIQLATKARCGRMLQLGVGLACELLGAPVSDPVQRRIQNLASRAAPVQEARRQLFEGSSKPPRFLEYVLFQMRSKDSVMDGLRFALRRAVSPGIEDWLSFRLPPPVRFLYFLLRPMRLMVKHAVHPACTRLSCAALQVKARVRRSACSRGPVRIDKGTAGERA